MNWKTVLVGLVVATLAYHAWRGSTTDVQSARAKAGIDRSAVVMLWVPECGAVCTDQVAEIKKRGLEVVTLDVDDQGKGTALWKAIGGGNGPFPTFLVGKDVIRPNDGDLRGKLLAKYGETALTGVEKYFFKKHFVGSSPKAMLYTAEWCGYCNRLRADLKSSNTPFLEIDVEKQANPDQLAEVMNIPGFPTVYFGYDRLQGDTDDIASQIRQRAKASR